jgi:hypothetical protein
MAALPPLLLSEKSMILVFWMVALPAVLLTVKSRDC